MAALDDLAALVSEAVDGVDSQGGTASSVEDKQPLALPLKSGPIALYDKYFFPHDAAVWGACACGSSTSDATFCSDITSADGTATEATAATTGGDSRKMLYSFITTTEVVEHLRDAGREIQRLWAHLRPGGMLLIQTGMYDEYNSQQAARETTTTSKVAAALNVATTVADAVLPATATTTAEAADGNAASEGRSAMEGELPYVALDRRMRTWHYIRDPTHICFFAHASFRWLAESGALPDVAGVVFCGPSVVALIKK
jgi:hypothetical protein